MGWVETSPTSTFVSFKALWIQCHQLYPKCSFLFKSIWVDGLLLYAPPVYFSTYSFPILDDPHHCFQLFIQTCVCCHWFVSSLNWPTIYITQFFWSPYNQAQINPIKTMWIYWYKSSFIILSPCSQLFSKSKSSLFLTKSSFFRELMVKLENLIVLSDEGYTIEETNIVILESLTLFEQQLPLAKIRECASR